MFPELCNRTITLFNGWPVKDDVVWFKTVISGVFLNSNSQYIQSKTGASIDTKNTLIIPYREGYLPPKQWNSIPKDTKDLYWTLGASDRDFYIVGEIEEEMPPYTEAQIKKLYENYDISIIDVKPNFDGGIHRFVVAGI